MRKVISPLRGREDKMTELRNAFICGTVRNCEQYLDRVFDNIRELQTLFNDTHIILYYDNSNDKTLLKLSQYKAIYNDKINIIVNRDPMSNRRTENISKARNSIIEAMGHYVGANTSENWPYFIMMDMDDVCSIKLNLDVVQRALEREAEWDTISFNRPGYYDIWALSIPPFIYSSWGWENPYNVVDIIRDYIINRLAQLPKNELLECQSAFNGFAIYKTDPFLKCRYDWRMPKQYMSIRELRQNQKALGNRNSFSPLDQQTDEPDCEHRAFHMSAIANYGARVRISPEYAFE